MTTVTFDSNTKTTCFKKNDPKWKIAVLTVLSSFLLPVLFLTTIPILLYRTMIQVWVWNFYRDRKLIHKILNGTTQVYATDYRKLNPRLNIVVCWIGEGKMTIDSMRKIILRTTINKMIGEGAEKRFEYEEMKCRIVSIGGYSYFKKIPNFNIKDYVNLSEPKNKEKVTTGEDIQKMITQLVSQGWQQNRAPWELILIENYVESDNVGAPNSKCEEAVHKSGFILRFHHTLADGYSFMNMTRNWTDGEFKMSAVPRTNLELKLNPGFKNKNRLLGMLLTPVLFPYQLALAFHELFQRDRNAWRIPQEKMKEVGQNVFYAWCGVIDVEDLKRIKNKFQVSFQTVLNAVLACAINKVMKGMGQELPDTMTVAVPLPLPGHPDGLCNYFGYIKYGIPVGESASSLTRLKLASEEVQSLANSTLPLMIYLTYAFFGLFPSLVARTLGDMDVGCTILFSTFAANDGLESIAGCNKAQFQFTLGNACGNIGATVSACTLNGKVRLGISIDQLVCPNEKELQKFDRAIAKEIKTLLSFSANPT